MVFREMGAERVGLNMFLPRCELKVFSRYNEVPKTFLSAKCYSCTSRFLSFNVVLILNGSAMAAAVTLDGQIGKAFFPCQTQNISVNNEVGNERMIVTCWYECEYASKGGFNCRSFVAEGSVADMGMDFGAGSAALASLYPQLQVVGVDVNPEMVERAAKTHVLPNLRFVVGDVAQPCLPAHRFDAILDSSVLHHVTSFNGYNRQAAMDAIGTRRCSMMAGFWSFGTFSILVRRWFG